MYRVERKEIFINSKETLSYRFRHGGPNILILLHDNYASSRNFDFLMENISEAYTLYAIDMRGFGNSSYLSKIAAIKDLSDDVFYFAKAIGIEKYSLLGWGLGGNVLMQYALDYPNTVHKLIFMNSYGLNGCSNAKSSDASHKTHKAFEAWKLNTNDRKLKKHLLKTHYHKNKPPKNRFNFYLREMKMQRNLEDVLHACSKFNLDPEQVKKIQQETLIIHGKKDKTVSLKEAKALKTILNHNATLHIVEKGDHAVMLGTLGETLRIVESFLTEKNPS